MKKTIHKALSMLLTAALILNMGIVPVFALEAKDCHQTHEINCSYSETVQMGGCTHEHNPDCGYAEATEGAPCTHKHDGACGYSESITVIAPCTHSCEQCAKGAEKICTCIPILNASGVGHIEGCPLYTAPEQSQPVKALIAMVDALPNADAITDENREKTTAAFASAAMAYEELSDEDKVMFEGTKQYQKLMALRNVLFGVASMAESDATNATNHNISNGDFTLTNDCGSSCGGHEVTGTTAQYKIIVASGVHDVTLSDVSIDVSKAESGCAFELQGTAEVNLVLVGTNTLKSGFRQAGLQVPMNASLIISGEGSLVTTGGENGAGIGNGFNTGGTITITGGSTVTATGGKYGAGIGGGKIGAGGLITISGSSTVTAIGGEYGTGIGNGNSGTGGIITITGNSTVTAIGGNQSAGIGGKGSSITISGGEVMATGGDYGAGIGGSINDAGDTITISGGVVTANSKKRGAGIGGGGGGAGGTITITGDSTVTATSGEKSAGIGGGWNGAGGTITISGDSTVKATGGEHGAGIGGGYDGEGGTITISDDSTVTASGGEFGAGIGGGWRGAGGTITISDDSTVTANGGEFGAGIGGGDYGDDGDFFTTADSKAVIFAEPSISDETRKDDWKGIIFEGSIGLVYGDVDLGRDLTIPYGKTLTVPVGVTLTIPHDMSLNNNGTIKNYGTIVGWPDKGDNPGNIYQSGEVAVSFQKSNSDVSVAGYGDTVKITATISAPTTKLYMPQIGGFFWIFAGVNIFAPKTIQILAMSCYIVSKTEIT